MFEAPASRGQGSTRLEKKPKRKLEPRKGLRQEPLRQLPMDQGSLEDRVTADSSGPDLLNIDMRVKLHSAISDPFPLCLEWPCAREVRSVEIGHTFHLAHTTAPETCHWISGASISISTYSREDLSPWD